jgi:hypothetical protein
MCSYEAIGSGMFTRGRDGDRDRETATERVECLRKHFKFVTMFALSLLFISCCFFCYAPIFLRCTLDLEARNNFLDFFALFAPSLAIYLFCTDERTSLFTIIYTTFQSALLPLSATRYLISLAIGHTCTINLIGHFD